MEQQTGSKSGKEYVKAVYCHPAYLTYTHTYTVVVFFGFFFESPHISDIYFCFIDYAKAFDCVDHNKLWKILKEMGIPDHLTCLLRNLCAGQEETVRTGHGKIDWLQVEKEVCQGYILSPSLFNLHAAHIMRNARLDESQAGIKISRININNLSPRSCKKLNMT